MIAKFFAGGDRGCEIGGSGGVLQISLSHLAFLLLFSDNHHVVVIVIILEFEILMLLRYNWLVFCIVPVLLSVVGVILILFEISLVLITATLLHFLLLHSHQLPAVFFLSLCYSKFASFIWMTHEEDSGGDFLFLFLHDDICHLNRHYYICHGLFLVASDRRWQICSYILKKELGFFKKFFSLKWL